MLKLCICLLFQFALVCWYVVLNGILVKPGAGTDIAAGFGNAVLILVHYV